MISINLIRHTIIALALGSMLTAAAQTPMDVHDTKYDWSQMARQIAGDKSSRYDQAYAIYRWLCDNISYDTSYSIHDADTAYEQKRGVCQAYCEMFYRLGEPLGLQVHVISGKSKDRDGNIPDMGHAWLFVFTDGNSGILIDPTWGAGSVDNHRFTRSVNDDSWFHVDPYWMIFTHYPDDSAYQLLDSPIDYAGFVRIKPRYPELGYFRFDPKQILDSELNGNAPDIPQCYYNKDVKVLKMPQEGTLRVGASYDFIVDGGNHEFAIINEKDYGKEWIASGSQQGIRFTPSSGGSLHLSYRDKGSQGKWTTMVGYKVAKPSPADIEALEKTAPGKSPRLTSLENYDATLLKSKGIDLAALLADVKGNGIKKIPRISSRDNFSINSAPMDGTLRSGRTYTFRISPYEAGDWVIINGDAWLRDWTQDPSTKAWVMTVTAAPGGKLQLGFKPEGDTGKSYSIMMEYDIR